VVSAVAQSYEQRRLMMTIEEIESACDASLPLDFSRHPHQGPELALRGLFYPFGFPAEVRTNSPEVLWQFGEIWGGFKQRCNVEPLRIDVHVEEIDSTECPPLPTFRWMPPILVFAADANNYSIMDPAQNRTQMTITSALVKHERYMRSFFLEGAAGNHIATRYAAPVHAGCVALDGRGILLCGDSGAGKSSLAYGCARAGWTFVSDDASFVLTCGDRMVAGNCYLARLRPTAAALFPELEGMEISRRGDGKPSVELPTAEQQQMICAQDTRVDFMVFLNRRAGGPPELVPYRKDVAWHAARQHVHGSAESNAAHYEALERLMAVDVLELRYTDMDWAIDRLRTLVREGH
jgi:hypothetical protein